MKRVAVLGASGYTGREFLRLLRHHPALELTHFMGSRAPGTSAPAPHVPGERAPAPLELARLEGLDGVFLCTPHAASAELALQCLALGLKVVDLSADFRLKDARTYERVYEHRHPAPQLLAEAVYGLTEHARESVASARLVANPGCYPTSVLLALKPLLAAGLVEAGTPIAANCASGLSGAGKQPNERTHFGNVHDNYLAYGAGTHRHAPEIEQEAGRTGIAFVPHLLPVFRGILATLYVQPRAGADVATLRACLAEAYRGERFVRVRESGLPELHAVQHTNECHIGLAPVGPFVVLVSAIDNLVKGASGQALQNMNLMLGLEEGAGLA